MYYVPCGIDTDIHVHKFAKICCTKEKVNNISLTAAYNHYLNVFNCSFNLNSNFCFVA